MTPKLPASLSLGSIHKDDLSPFGDITGDFLDSSADSFRRVMSEAATGRTMPQNVDARRYGAVSAFPYLNPFAGWKDADGTPIKIKQYGGRETTRLNGVLAVLIACNPSMTMTDISDFIRLNNFDGRFDNYQVSLSASGDPATGTGSWEYAVGQGNQQNDPDVFSYIFYSRKKFIYDDFLPPKNILYQKWKLGTLGVKLPITTGRTLEKEKDLLSQAMPLIAGYLLLK